MNWHLAGLIVRMCFKCRCSVTELLLLHRDNSTTPLRCALLLYFISNAGTSAFKLGSNTKLNFSPLDRPVFWYQQTDPHTDPRGI